MGLWTFIFGPDPPSPKEQELAKTRAQWTGLDAAWKSSPVGSEGVGMLALTVLSNLRQVHGRLPDPPLFGALLDSIVDLFDLEEIGSITPEWPLIESDVEAAVSFRRLLDARSRWVHGFDARFDAIRSYLLPILDDLLHAVPQSCFEAPAAAGLSFDVPVGDLIHNPAGLIGKLVLLPFVARAESLGVFRALRAQTELNLLTASGLPPHTVRRQKFWDSGALDLAEDWARLGLISRRRFCGAASADVRGSVA